MLERRRLVAAQRADDPGEEHGERVAAGVDDARLAQHRQQVGPAHDRVLAGLERRSITSAIDASWSSSLGVRSEAGVLAMWASSAATRCAISRTTVRIVPSAGSRTEA